MYKHFIYLVLACLLACLLAEQSIAEQKREYLSSKEHFSLTKYIKNYKGNVNNYKAKCNNTLEIN